MKYGSVLSAWVFNSIFFIAVHCQHITTTIAFQYILPNGVSIPHDFPSVKISTKNNPDSGKIFLSNLGGTPYLTILDNNGLPTFYKRMPANAQDFKVQKNGMLSYWLAAPYNRFFEMDSSYTVTREIKAGVGYETDEHELQLLPNGNALLIALDTKKINLSSTGGNPSATVIGNTLQEITPEGNVVFEWKSWDHFNIFDAVNENLKGGTIDYVHMNAIEIDNDGNILVSSRHLSEITKINRKNGEILWRLGGVRNQFTFIDDTLFGTSYQHDIRVLPNGNYTMMDNGNYHPQSITRAVEYKLDTAAKTATLVWQYRTKPDRHVPWMGNVQRLPNRNTLINWAEAALPKLTELSPKGEKAMELNFVNSAMCYRTFRFPWKGKSKAPYLLLEPRGDTIALLFNTFGNDAVKKYFIYADTIPHPKKILDSSSATAIDVSGLKNGMTYYFRITSKDSAGYESQFSNEEQWQVKIFMPGDNIVLNGDFSEGMNQWSLQLSDSAIAQSTITAAGELQVHNINGGTQTTSVQLTQNGIPLTIGKKYLFEFDAYASANRIIDVKLEKVSVPFINYSQTSLIAVSSTKKHFSFPFTMQYPTDADARLVLNCGGSPVDFFVDNILVKEVVGTEVKKNKNIVPEEFLLYQNYPNPFNPSTVVSYQLPITSKVSLKMYDVLGREVATLVNEQQQTGLHNITVSISKHQLSSGMYFYTLTAENFSSTKRMVLLK